MGNLKNTKSEIVGGKIPAWHCIHSRCRKICATVRWSAFAACGVRSLGANQDWKTQDRLKSARLCVLLRLSHAEFDLLDRIKTYNKKQARLRSILTFNESRKFLKEQPLSLPNCEMFILGEHFLSCGKKCLDEWKRTLFLQYISRSDNLIFRQCLCFGNPGRTNNKK